MAADSRQLVRDVRDGQGTLGKLLTDDALYTHATGIAEEMEIDAAGGSGSDRACRVDPRRFSWSRRAPGRDLE